MNFLFNPLKAGCSKKDAIRLKSSGVAAFVLVLAERVALCQQFGRFWAGSVTNGAEGPTTPPS